jgi:SAM-dependent methyltransferase
MAETYREDLAYIHDAGHGGFARGAAPVLLGALRQAKAERGLVIDLGCGSGILAAEVAAAGYDILGYDLSAAMLALARRRVPQGRFHQESLLKADLPACVAVTAIGECFNFLFDRGNTDQALARLFRRVHNALCPDGLFLFDVAEPGRVPGGGPRRDYREGEDWAVLVTAEEDRRRQLLTRRITSFRKAGKLYRRAQEVHQLRLFRGAVLARQLREIGFRVRLLRGYGAFRFPPGCVALLGRKAVSPP